MSGWSDVTLPPSLGRNNRLFEKNLFSLFPEFECL